MLSGLFKNFSRKKEPETEQDNAIESDALKDSDKAENTRGRTPVTPSVQEPEPNKPMTTVREQAEAEKIVPFAASMPATTDAVIPALSRVDKQAAKMFADTASTEKALKSIVVENTVLPEPLAQANDGATVIMTTPKPSSYKGELSMANNVDSKEAVAFQLMQHIGAQESPTDESKSTRGYWLKLYRECFRTVNGRKRVRKNTAPAADSGA